MTVIKRIFPHTAFINLSSLPSRARKTKTPLTMKRSHSVRHLGMKQFTHVVLNYFKKNLKNNKSMQKNASTNHLHTYALVLTTVTDR